MSDLSERHIGPYGQRRLEVCVEGRVISGRRWG
jgi:hypothetical protein